MSFTEFKWTCRSEGFAKIGSGTRVILHMFVIAARCDGRPRVRRALTHAVACRRNGIAESANETSMYVTAKDT